MKSRFKSRCLLLLTVLLTVQLQAQQQSTPYAIQVNPISPDSTHHCLVPAPTPNGMITYDYLWWFGDNYYSFSTNPTHSYRLLPTADSMYTVITENYSNAGPPPMMQHRIPNGQGGNGSPILDNGEKLRVQNFRNAVPEDKIYFIVSYASNWMGEGSIELNIDPQYMQYFSLPVTIPEAFTPNQEYNLPGTCNWNFNFDPNQLDRSLLIPFNVDQSIESVMYEPIWVETVLSHAGTVVDRDTVTFYSMPSHDPNLMIPHKKVDHDCRIDGETFTYTVHFQNTGEGPTSDIVVKTFLDERLDPNSIKTMGFHQSIPPCSGNSSGSCYTQTFDSDSNAIIWTLRNTILLGSGQPDCMDLNHTKGWIEFQVDGDTDCRMGDDVICHSEIYFDENPKVVTNDAVMTCNEEERSQLPCEEEDAGGSNTWPFVIVIIGVLVAIVLGVLGLKFKKNRQED